MQTQPTAVATTTCHDDEYVAFSQAVRDSFAKYASGPLFTTTDAPWFDLYLASIPEQYRQHYNCHACRRFLNTYGGLVAVADDGQLIPVCWDFELTGFFENTAKALRAAVRAASITDVFAGRGATVLGTPQTNEWSHLAVMSDKPIHGESRLADYITVSRFIKDYREPNLDRALVLLRGDALYRGEKILGQAEWLKSLYGISKPLFWRAIATAPAGFCHPRASMIGTLLDDMESGMPVDDAARRFAAKMSPVKYQRPSKQPSSQTIDKAEKIIAEMKAAGSLRRRFLKPYELKSFWTPPPVSEPKQGGVFDSVRPGQSTIPAESGIPIRITWVKFRQTVLPMAEKIYYQTRREPSAFAVLVTAVNTDAPPILQWDLPEKRNPVSWYLYQFGSDHSHFGLFQGRHEVYAIALQPNQWTSDDQFAHHGSGVFFAIQGCHDKNNRTLGLFPECLRSELHGVRAVIEAYSKKTPVEGRMEEMCAGIMVQKSAQAINETFVVVTSGQSIAYVIDRFD